jgi:hypothetical protein
LQISCKVTYANKPVTILILILIIVSQSVSDQKSEKSEGEELQLRLVTIGSGDDLTSWWGHTAIVVDNNRTKVSRFYNYGLFSFDQENFFINFAMGRLIFWVGAWNTSDALAHYVSQNREIRVQILNLDPEKRKQIAAFLTKNILPGNRDYLYDHYLDNCSTRVRDLIDMILDHQLYQATQGRGKLTFRQHTRRHTDKNFIIDWFLMFLMNDSIDQKINQWDDMFLPEELEYYVGQLTYRDEKGDNHPLVQRSYTYYQAGNRSPLPSGVPAHWPYGLAIGIFSGLSAVLAGIVYRHGFKFARLLLGSIHAFIGIIYGLPGLILFFMGFFTDHRVTFYNENLLLANPLTLLLIPLGIGLIVGKEISLRWLPKLWYLLAGLNLLLILLKILPSFDQQNWLSISFVVPLSISMLFSWYLINKSK